MKYTLFLFAIMFMLACSSKDKLSEINTKDNQLIESMEQSEGYLVVSKPFLLNPTPMKRLELEFNDNSNVENDSSEVVSPPVANNSNEVNDNSDAVSPPPPPNDSNDQNPPIVLDDEPLVPTFERIPDVVDYISVGHSKSDSQIINEKRHKVWLNPLCNDGVRNGDETGIDCGGSCSPCRDSVSVASLSVINPQLEESTLPNCDDGIKNGNEIGIDCGGNCPPCNKKYPTFTFRLDVYDMDMEEKKIGSKIVRTNDVPISLYKHLSFPEEISYRYKVIVTNYVTGEVTEKIVDDIIEPKPIPFYETIHKK